MLRIAALLLAAPLCACAPHTPDELFDVLIVNGTVYDGSLAPPAQRNIGISGGVIASINAPLDATAVMTIDAAGRIVTPGFIDPHTHASLDANDAKGSAHLNFLTQGITTVVVGNDGGGIENRADTLAALTEAGSGANVAYFAGHGAIRSAVMDYADRPPTDDELRNMQDLLIAEMNSGALGLSAGLYYAPGSFAKTPEIIELARVAAEMGGIYETHLRDEGSYNIGVVAAVEEAIEIARQANIPAHISHIKALGKDTWGLSAEIVGVISDARAEGLDITANQYPWRASNVALSSALVPRWVMAGSEKDMRDRLGDPALAERIHNEMRDNLARRGGPDAMLVTTSTSSYRGLTLTEVARLMERDPVAAAIELVVTEAPSIASFVMNQDDIDTLRVQPWLMTGSDGGDGHPRFFASYPKAWQDFVVERQLLSPEQLIHSSTGQVADTLRLCDRGYIRTEYAADIAVIDADRFRPLATFEEPDRLSTGVEHLLVNGRLIIKGSEYQHARAGLILERNAADCAS